MADYNTFQKNWTERLTAFKNQGIDLKPAIPIIRQDFERLNRGEQVLTNAEAIASIVSAARKEGVISEPSKKSGLAQLPGNAVTDISSILRGISKLPGALFTEVKSLQDIPQAVAEGDWSSPGDILRSAATVPGVRFIPGVYTASQLTTPEGRKELATHPVTAGLDVLPVAGKVAKIGAQKAAKAGVIDPSEVARKTQALKTARQTGREGLLPDENILSRSERTYAAAARGRPLSALLEASGVKPQIARLTDPITDQLKASTRLSKAYNQISRQAQLEINSFIRQFQEQIAPFWTKMDDAEKALLYNEWVNPRDYPNPSAEHRAILAAGRAVQDKLANEGIKAGALFPVTVDGRTFIYPKSGQPNLRLLNSIEHLSKVQSELSTAQAALPPVPSVLMQYKTPAEAIKSIEQKLSPPSIQVPPMPWLGKKYRSLNEAILDLKAKLNLPLLDPQIPPLPEIALQFKSIPVALKALQNDPTIIPNKLLRDIEINRLKDYQKAIDKVRQTRANPHITPQEQALYRDQLSTLMARQKALQLIKNKKGSTLTQGQRLVLKSQLKSLKEYTAASDKVNSLYRKSRSARYQMLENFLNTAPAAFHPILESDIRQQAIAMVKGEYDKGAFGKPQLDEALKAIDQGDFRRVFDPESPVVGKGVFEPFTLDKLIKDVQGGWWALASQGLDPIFLHNVPDWQPFRAERAKIVSLNEIAPGQFLPKDLMDMSPRYTNVGIALPAGVAEYINTRGTENFITDVMIPHGFTYEEVLRAEQPAIDRLVRRGLSPESARGKVLSSYKLVRDASDFGITSNKVTGRMGGRELYIPDHVFRAAQSLMKSRTPDTLFSKITTKGTAIFKASLFTLSPRHFVDEVFGNFLLMMGRGGVDELRNFNKAVQQVTGGMPFWKGMAAAARGELPDFLSPLMSRGIDIMSADQILQTALGKKLGKLTHQLGASQRVMEFLNNIERVMGYLGEETRQLRKGATPDIAREAAFEHLNKTFVDWDSMTPIERTLIRQWFPFYSFTRFIAQYLYTYPADHPIRASIISHLSNAEREDLKSGLPGKFDQLFFFGQPNVEGNIKVSDVRSINPFRDSGNIFTLAGFFSSLSPFAQIPLQIAGVNTLAGTPELYPELSIDPTTGTLTSKRQNIASPSGAIEAISAFLPPIGGGIDHFVGISDRVRRLKATDPTGYRRQLLSSLGIPFVPYNLNVPVELSKQQRNLARVGSQRLSEATRQGGDTTELRRFNIVPWQGQLVSGKGIADIIDKLHSASDKTGIPTKILMAELAKMVK